MMKRMTILSRLGAWITIQALLFGQIPATFADTLRVAQPESKAGLEEIKRGLQGPAQAGLEERADYSDLLTLAVPAPAAGEAWKNHSNFRSLERIFGSREAAERAVMALLNREDPEGRRGLTPYHLVQGLLHPNSLGGFLGRATPEAPSGEWTRLWQDRNDGAVGFTLEQLSKVSAGVLDFGSGSSLQTNSQVSHSHPLLRGLEVVGVTNNSDNGGRTQEIFDALLPHYGPTERPGDATAGIKGSFSPTVQENVLEPDHKGFWQNPQRWSSLGAGAGSFRTRVEFLLAEFARQPGRVEVFDREEGIPFLRMAVELLNMAVLTDQHFIAPNRLDINLPSVRHMIRNAIFAAVGAYDAQRGGVHEGRYWVGVYLAAQAFGPLVLVNSTAPQELYAEWEGPDGKVRTSMESISTPRGPGAAAVTITDRGQVAISLYPDARAGEAGVVHYLRFGAIDPESAAQGRVEPIEVPRDEVLEALIRQAKPGALVRFGPSSFVVSLSSIILPSYARIIAEGRPDLGGTLVLNLTRNSETLGWSLGDYVEFWEQVTGYPLERTVKYLLINTRWPREEAFAEARAVALAAGGGTVQHYPNALEQFDPSAPAYHASIGRLRNLGVQDPEEELVLALAFSDHGDTRATYKDRGGVPIPSPEELEQLRHRGITVILDDFAATRGEKYIPGKGRITVFGAYHGQARLARAYAWIAEEQKRRVDLGEPLAQGGIHNFSQFPLEPFDPLDLQAMEPPLAEILCDLDETGAPDRDASISDETAARIEEYVRLGGRWRWLSNRDEENITRRGRVAEIRLRLGKRAEARVGFYAGSGIAHPALQPLVAGRWLNPETLRQALAQVTGQAQPNAVYPGEATGSPAHTIYEYGDVALYQPKPGAPPGTMAIYAYRPAVDAGRMTKQQAGLARPGLRAALMGTGLFPEGQVWLQYAGTTSINVEVAGKSDLIREVYLNDPARQGQRLAVLEDEALAGFSGYSVFTLIHPNLVQVAVDSRKISPSLPPRVIRSGRQGPDAVNRFLDIEIAKRRAMRRLKKKWEDVAARIARRPPGKSAAQALFELAAGMEEAEREFLESWDRVREQMKADPGSPSSWLRELLDLVDNDAPYWWFGEAAEFLRERAQPVPQEVLGGLAGLITDGLDRYRQHAVLWLVHALASRGGYVLAQALDVPEELRGFLSETEGRVRELDDRANEQQIREMLGDPPAALAPLARQGANKFAYRATWPASEGQPARERVVKVTHIGMGIGGPFFHRFFTEFSDDDERIQASYLRGELERKAKGRELVPTLYEEARTQLPDVQFRGRRDEYAIHAFNPVVRVEVEELVPGEDLQTVLDRGDADAPAAVEAARQTYREIWETLGWGIPYPQPEDVVVRRSEAGEWTATVVDLDRFEQMDEKTLEERLAQGLKAGLEESAAAVAPAVPPAPVTPTLVGPAAATATANRTPATLTVAQQALADSARQQINLLPQLTLASQASVAAGALGVIAGPEDDRGLAAGVAISRRAVGPDGKLIPVVFITKDEAQHRALIALGVSEESILRVGAGERYGTVNAAVDQATSWLRGMWNASRIIPLGVDDTIPPQMIQVLRNLFGVELEEDESVEAWQEAVEEAHRLIQA